MQRQGEKNEFRVDNKQFEVTGERLLTSVVKITCNFLINPMLFT